MISTVFGRERLCVRALPPGEFGHICGSDMQKYSARLGLCSSGRLQARKSTLGRLKMWSARPRMTKIAALPMELARSLHSLLDWRHRRKHWQSFTPAFQKGKYSSVTLYRHERGAGKSKASRSARSSLDFGMEPNRRNHCTSVRRRASCSVTKRRPRRSLIPWER